MSERDSAHLLEIETACGYIESFVDGFDEPTFLDDSRTSAAVSMYLIVIGEASLSVETRNEAPEIPWAQVIALRNRIAHGCQRIDRAAIWAIVQANLPPLRAAVRRMLAERGEAPA